MCNLYSMTAPQEAIRRRARALVDRTGNLPSMPAIWPDTAAPVVRQGAEGRELTLARWGMPSPAFALRGHKVDRGVTNIRNLSSAHWRRWLGIEHRCLVPFTSFSEMEHLPDGSIRPVWFADGPERPLCFFAGIWTSWTSVRKVKEGEVTADLFGFLTTEANAVVAPVHPKAMPVILTEPEEFELWLTGPFEIARELQRPLDPGKLESVGRGEREDKGE
ncbi:MULTISPECIES: SOS response-associated peptidase [Acetobacter]|uniref:Abasic site processing protein n=2 Tax=Acetobacter TaxID=434 RepID=A0ABX0KCP3_9PROT|nr:MULTISPECIES: SOS response-associated peptidase family protein [Acetobacter]NHN89958.1 SOS response-associated peptidase [Acetobacter conturbans]NHO33770.1 SOS response-associated peptidase [Acetobacter fallax]NHO37331.1 SOS response-associated peptidase [Acetobacter fallax]